MGFTQHESLAVLARDGTYRLYPVTPAQDQAASAQAYSQHSLAHDVGDAVVHDARIYEGGMVILLSTYQFIELKGWPERDILSERSSSAALIASSTSAQSRVARPSPESHGSGRIERFVDSGLDRYPSAWCILTPEQSASRQAEVLMSVSESLLGIDQLEVQDQVSCIIREPVHSRSVTLHSALLSRPLRSHCAISLRTLHRPVDREQTATVASGIFQLFRNLVRVRSLRRA